MTKPTFSTLLFFAAIYCLTLNCIDAKAAPPWEKLVTMQKVEADPDKDYNLKESDGPWLIMATSFSGEGAEDQARELVLELRSRYKVAAYMHRQEFDFSRKVQGRGIDKFGNPLKMKYRTGDSLNEIAVLVGDFDAIGLPRSTGGTYPAEKLQAGMFGRQEAQTNEPVAGFMANAATRVQACHRQQKES